MFDPVIFPRIAGHIRPFVASGTLGELGNEAHLRRLDQELDREANALRAGYSGSNPDGSAQPTIEQRERVRFLVSESEKPALAAEEEVWRELQKSRTAKTAPGLQF